MAALWNRAGHYIFALWFLSFFFFLLYFFSPNLSGRRLDVYHTSTHWCGLSANLECMSEKCCMRLAENTGRKNYAKNRHLCTITQLCRAISSQLSHVLTIGKKLVKQQYLLQMSLQYGELGPTNGWDRFGSLEHPSTFQQVLGHGFVTTAMALNGRQPNFVRCLAISWTGTPYLYSVPKYTFTGLAPARASAKICDMLQGMEIQNFHRGRHLYLAGRPSRWTSAHILVYNSYNN